MRRSGVKAAVVAATCLVVATGCSHTIDGQAQRAQPGTLDPDRSFGYIDDRCGLLVDKTIQDVLHADNVVRPYSGAVCQYVLSRGEVNGSPAMIDVVFSWFESGTLPRERSLAQERGAQVTDVVVERRDAFLARRDVTGAACAATAAAGSGVLSWWVQFRGQQNGDPCQDAELLLSKTLQSEL